MDQPGIHRGLSTRLHEHGHAHSVECWQAGELVGGIYGVAVGGFFAGESMFHRASNASKVALFHLLEHLRARDFALFDIQMVTPFTRQMGAVTIPRARNIWRALPKPSIWTARFKRECKMRRPRAWLAACGNYFVLGRRLIARQLAVRRVGFQRFLVIRLDGLGQQGQRTPGGLFLRG